MFGPSSVNQRITMASADFSPRPTGSNQARFAVPSLECPPDIHLPLAELVSHLGKTQLSVNSGWIYQGEPFSWALV